MALYDYKKLRLKLLKRSARYNAGVKHLYDVALNDMAREFALLDYNPDTVFSFENYGVFGRADGIMSRLERDIQSVVNAAVANEFGAAYEANNELIRKILGDNVSNEIIRAFAPKMSSGNAAKIFNLEHQAGNITESMRVWNGATLGQMETAVQEALMDGMPAKQMAGLMEEYLNDPESCFRRFRIKTGVDADGMSMYGRKWMKRVRNADGTTSWFDADPRDYPTGQGVYHSSYQNALRYTRTTTNIAYRTADYERYQTEDFVLGIEIHITGNPAHKEDICDMLAGRYPKDFKWTGWHPNCMCYEIPILATPEEVNAMADAILNDQDPSTVPVTGRVTDVPDNFKQWVADNEDRIQDTLDRGKELPYFLRDNGFYLNKARGMNGGIYGSTYGSMEVESLSPTIRLDLTDVRSMIDEVAQKHPDYFKHGFNGIEYATSGSKYYMSTDINGTIYINFAEKDGFDAGTSLVNAISKIKNSEILNENEEYSIEALWHEILHNSSSNRTILPNVTDASRGFERVSVETLNQLVARHTYQKLIKDFGVSPLHKEWILENGFGYKETVKNLRCILKRGGIDEQEFVNKSYNLLMGDYTGMDTKIKTILIEMNKDGMFDIANAFNRIELSEFYRFI